MARKPPPFGAQRDMLLEQFPWAEYVDYRRRYGYENTERDGRDLARDLLNDLAQKPAETIAIAGGSLQAARCHGWYELELVTHVQVRAGDYFPNDGRDHAVRDPEGE